MIDNVQKLEVIENLIEQWRSEREGDPVRRQVYTTLKAIADDLRAPAKASDTVTRMDRAITNAKARRRPTGHYEMGNLQEIAELTIGRWPTIRQALEKFE